MATRPRISGSSPETSVVSSKKSPSMAMRSGSVFPPPEAAPHSLFQTACHGDLRSLLPGIRQTPPANPSSGLRNLSCRSCPSPGRKVQSTVATAALAIFSRCHLKCSPAGTPPRSFCLLYHDRQEVSPLLSPPIQSSPGIPLETFRK